MNLKGDQLRDVVFPPDFRGKDLLHHRMVHVRRRNQRFAAQITDCCSNFFHSVSVKTPSVSWPTIADFMMIFPNRARHHPSFSARFAALLNFLMMRSRLSFEMWSMNSTPLR